MLSDRWRQGGALAPGERVWLKKSKWVFGHEVDFDVLAEHRDCAPGACFSLQVNPVFKLGFGDFEVCT